MTDYSKYLPSKEAVLNALVRDSRRPRTTSCLETMDLILAAIERAVEAETKLLVSAISRASRQAEQERATHARALKRARLKAQIETMSEWADHGDFHSGPPRRADEPCRACSKLRYLQAELAALDAEDGK